MEKNPHHCSKRVGDVNAGSVANLSWAGWVICKEISEYRDHLMFLL